MFTMAVMIKEPARLAVGPLLRVEALSVRYDSFTALDAIDFDIRPGETVALAGENGAGKSTLVRCIGGDMIRAGVLSLYRARPVTLAGASAWPDTDGAGALGTLTDTETSVILQSSRRQERARQYSGRVR